MSVDPSKVIRDLLSASETDRSGGMSLLPAFIKLYESSEDRDALAEALVRLIHDSDEEQLSAYAWLAGGLAANGVKIAGVAETLTARLMEYYQSGNCSPDLIRVLEEQIALVTRPNED